MRLILLLLLILLSSNVVVNCKAPSRVLEDRRKQQDEIGIVSQQAETSEMNPCKHCFLGRVLRNFVTTDPKDVDRTHTKFDPQEMINTDHENPLVETKLNNRPVDTLPMQRAKRSCWYAFASRDSGNPAFTVRCSKEEKRAVSMTTQTTQMTKMNTGSTFASKLLRILGYEVYTEQGKIPIQQQEVNAKGKMPSEYTVVHADRGRKLTSAERKQHRANPNGNTLGTKNAKRKEGRRKNKLNTKGKTSAEKKRAKKKKRISSGTKKRRKIHYGEDHPDAGGNSEEKKKKYMSSVWSSIMEPEPTTRARRLPVTKTSKQPTQAPLTTMMSTGEKPATKWWNKFKWLFNTSVIITGPDGTHWYFPTITKNPTAPLTAAPTTQSSKGMKITNMVTSETTQFLFTMRGPVLRTLGHGTEPLVTASLQKPTMDHGSNPTAFPVHGTKRTLWDDGNPVFRVSDAPSHKWFPGQNSPTHRWYGHGARPTESHTWFTDKNGGSEKDIHKWFGQQTIKPVTSHNWFPDAGEDGGSHKWFDQEEDRTYWWWGSAYRVFLPENDVLESHPVILEKLLQKLFKSITIDIFPK